MSARAFLPRIHGVQVMRRMVQLGVVLALLTVPVLARYNNYLAARELDRHLQKWEGTGPGTVLAAVDGVMRALPGGEMERAGTMQRDRDVVLGRVKQVRGGAWSAEVAGISMTDPLAAAESVAASRRLPWVLVVGLLLPVLVTLVFGRVFCSWVCPAGLLFECTDKLRAALPVVEIHPRNVHVARSVKYGLLATGLVLAALLAVPVLGYVYPPAILSRELHDAVLAVFDRAELGRFGFWLGGFSWMILLIGAIVAVEVLVSRRWWCRYVCPGGALYSLIGWARPVRVKLRAERCTRCAACVPACPMGLNPMQDKMGVECDNCGVCIASCGDAALGYGVQTPLAQLVRRRHDGGAR